MEIQSKVFGKQSFCSTGICNFPITTMIILANISSITMIILANISATVLRPACAHLPPHNLGALYFYYSPEVRLQEVENLLQITNVSF